MNVRAIPAVLVVLAGAGCGKTPSDGRSAAGSAAIPTSGSAARSASASDEPAGSSVGSAGSAADSARTVRTTAADRGHLRDVIAREQQAGRTPLLEVRTADCPNCATVASWFTGAPFGQVSVIEVDGGAFKSELAALHLPSTAICFYVLDGARWKGDLCAMPSGTLGTAVADSIREQIKPTVH